MQTDDSATRPAQEALPGPGRPGRESREEIVARVMREQADLDLTPVYSASTRRRLRMVLLLVPPAGLLLGWLMGVVFGWTTLEWSGAAVGLMLALTYFGYLFVSERDDGRIQARARRIAEARARERG